MSGLVVDVPCHRGSTAHDLLVYAADKLNRNTIDRVWLYKNKSTSIGSAVNPDLIADVPLKALAALLSNSSSEIEGKSKSIVIFLRNSEMLDIHTLDNLIILLNRAKLPAAIHVLAFTDVLCQLPVHLTASAVAQIRSDISSTATPWDIFEAVSSKLFSARDIPIAFSPSLTNAIRLPFEESELCVISAIHRCNTCMFSVIGKFLLKDHLLSWFAYRFKVCLSHHFGHRSSLLTMYKETGWLQQVSEDDDR